MTYSEYVEESIHKETSYVSTSPQHKENIYT
jgi:hypothetical protein